MQMVRSMTGYGRAQRIIDGRDITVEIKSVNHRFLEFTARVPRGCGYLEEKLKSYMQGRAWRPDSDGRSGQHGCRGQSGTGGGVYPRPAGARQTVWAYRRPFGLVDLPLFRDFYRPPRAGGRGCGLGSGAGSDRGGRRTVPADAGTGRRKASGRLARPAFAD